MKRQHDTDKWRQFAITGGEPMASTMNSLPSSGQCLKKKKHGFKGSGPQTPKLAFTVTHIVPKDAEASRTSLDDDQGSRERAKDGKLHHTRMRSRPSNSLGCCAGHVKYKSKSQNGDHDAHRDVLSSRLADQMLIGCRKSRGHSRDAKPTFNIRRVSE